MVGTSSSPVSEFVTADRNRFITLFHCGRLKQTVRIQPVRESIIKFHIRDIRRIFVPDLMSDRCRVLFVERAARDPWSHVRAFDNMGRKLVSALLVGVTENTASQQAKIYGVRVARQRPLFDRSYNNRA